MCSTNGHLFSVYVPEIEQGPETYLGTFTDEELGGTNGGTPIKIYSDSQLDIDAFKLTTWHNGKGCPVYIEECKMLIQFLRELTP